jgi:hypothetical protein
VDELEYSKHRRQDIQPLPLHLVSDLKKHLANKLPLAPAFNVPGRTDFSRMFRADLNAARKAWIEQTDAAEDRAEREQSNFLAYQDDAGRFADAPSLRHTFISNLVAGGVNPKTAQRLARHGTIGLTMDRYTHVFQGDVTAALSVLPDLSIPAANAVRMTGTDGTVVAKARVSSVSPSVSPGGEIPASGKESGGANDATGEDSESAGKLGDLTEFPGESKLSDTPRRSGRAVECAGLENR